MSVQTERLAEIYQPCDLLERTREIFEIECALGRLANGVTDESIPRGAGESVLRGVGDLPPRGAGLLVVDGNAGTGRTSLLNHVVTCARHAGINVLSASGGVSEREVPYGLCGQLLGVPPAPARGLDLDASASQSTDLVFAAMHRGLAKRCAAGPSVIVIDDVQLLDELSLRWLAYLSRRISTLPALLVVAISRDIETSPAGATLMVELRHRLDAVTLRPAALTGHAAADLLGRHTGRTVPEAAAAVCVELTGGNPLLLVELARTLAREDIDLDVLPPGRLALIAPPGVAQYVLSKIAHLPTAVKQVARALAVLGPSAGGDVIAAMCSIGPETVHDALLTLNRLGIVNSIRPAQYVHPLVRNAVYADMRADVRQRYHRTAAALLHIERGVASDVARHLLAASPTADHRNIEMLCQVAADLLAADEYVLAAECLRRVVRGPMPPERRARLELTLGAILETRDPQAAVGYLRQAIAVLDDPRQLGRAHLSLARALAGCGRTPEAVEVLAGCAERLADVQPALAERLRDVQLMLSLLHADTIDSAGATLAQIASSIAGHAQPVPRAVRATWSGAGRISAMRQMNRFLEVPPALSQHPLEHAAAVLTLLHADHSDQAAGYLKAIADKAPHVAEVVAVRAAVELVNGDVSRSVRSARRAVELVEAGGTRPLLLDHRAVLACALSESGEYLEASSVFGETGPAGDQPGDWHVNHYLEARGRLRVAAGEMQAGLADLLECGRRLKRWDVDNPLVNGWRCGAAVALSQTGDYQRALALAEEQLRAAYFWGAPRAIGIALRARGLIEKEPRKRARWLAQAVAQLRNSPAVLDLAQSMLDLGRAMALQGEILPARDQLREGLAIAQRSGSTALAARAHDELLRSGARPRRRAQFGRDSLTDAELRTALMATGGLTNRQIARELFVTQRTVELHLTNTYRKLQVRNRADLGVALNDAVVAEA